MTILQPRKYQRAAVDAVHAAWESGVRRPATVLGTGAGKTQIFCYALSEYLQRNPGRRALVVAHRTELVEQAAHRMATIAPDMRIGVVKANRNETLADVIVASVQTLASVNRRRQLQRVGRVVIDECHRAAAPTYLQVLQHFGAMDGPASWPGEDAKALGVTATMIRGDDLALGDVWERVVYTRSIAQLIADGWLVRPRGIHVKVDDLDLSGVSKRAGAKQDEEVGAALEASLAPEAIAKAYAEHARDRQGLVFAPTVASAALINDALVDAGFVAVLVHGKTPADQRAQAIKDFKAGRVQILTNCGIFTEGTDLPMASAVVVARPCTHQGLLVQIVGRVLRLAPGKEDALVLDVVGATKRHALQSPIQLFGEDAAELVERLAEDEPTDADDAEAPTDLDATPLGPMSDFTEYVDGPLAYEDVDLFHGSASLWLQTRAGVHFLPAGERYIALLPRPDSRGYDVVSMHRYQHHTGRYVAQAVDDMGYAMAWAEGDVTPAEAVTARRDRSWRAKRPSEGMRNLAARHRIVVPDSMRAGELSALITVTEASQRIDSGLPQYLTNQ